MFKDFYWKGWSFEQFSESEMEDATGSTWLVGFSVDSLGFELTLIRYQLAWRRDYREEAQA